MASTAPNQVGKRVLPKILKAVRYERKTNRPIFFVWKKEVKQVREKPNICSAHQRLIAGMEAFWLKSFNRF